jgi:ribosomal-protein-alanine N-acetyltransferase
MEQEDISEVVEIDRESFDPPWTRNSYAFEIAESTYTYMTTLVRNELQELQGLKSLLFHLRGNHGIPIVKKTVVVGYGGLWKIAEEAHISTIASHADYRGCGYGAVLLVGMIQRAMMLGAEYIVLEVRVSNKVAQNLYRKFGFHIVALKEKYYRNGEDAYDMRLRLDHPDNIVELRQKYEEVKQRVPFQDLYSTIAHPRLGT